MNIFIPELTSAEGILIEKGCMPPRKSLARPANFINFNLLRQALLTCLGFDQAKPFLANPRTKP